MLHRIERLVLVALFLALAAAPGRAQEESLGSSFLTPFPANDVYRVEVVGDTFAEGLLSGLSEAFKGDVRVEILKKVRALQGLTRANFDDDMKTLETETATDTVHLSIVMVGAWDRNNVRDPQGRRLNAGSPEWKVDYARRVDRLMRALRKRNSAVYWVSLPTMRRPQQDADAKMMNEIVRERAYLNGQKFIDVYAGFADENGAYNAYGPDLKGKYVLLREGDGIGFTDAGHLKLAHFVESELRRDLTQAKGERAIPLAGSEAEQARIATAKASPPKPVDNAAKPRPAAAPEAPAPQSAGPAPQAASAAAQPSGELKPDNGRVSFKARGPEGREDTITVDILRPPISASVVALLTRRESADKPSQIGDPVTDQVAGGLTVMSTIAPAVDAGGPGSRKVSPTQTPDFRVRVKGERLPAKPGRADDLTWPRPQAVAVDPGAGRRFNKPAEGLIQNTDALDQDRRR